MSEQPATFNEGDQVRIKKDTAISEPDKKLAEMRDKLVVGEVTRVYKNDRIGAYDGRRGYYIVFLDGQTGGRFYHDELELAEPGEISKLKAKLENQKRIASAYGEILDAIQAIVGRFQDDVLASVKDLATEHAELKVVALQLSTVIANDDTKISAEAATVLRLTEENRAAKRDNMRLINQLRAQWLRGNHLSGSLGRIKTLFNITSHSTAAGKDLLLQRIQAEANSCYSSQFHDAIGAVADIDEWLNESVTEHA